MDYTKNYHLPQWVKSDRIMMDDFNRMCADIENGLTGNRTEFRQKDSELSGQLQRVEREALERDQSNSSTVQASLQGGLFHIAYNHYHLLAAAPVQPWQIGFFHQRLGGSAEPVSGWMDRGWALWLPNGTGSYTSADFRAQMQQIAEMRVVKGNAAANTPLVIQFTPPGPGYFTALPLAANIQNNQGSSGKWHIALRNTATGEYEDEADYLLNMQQTGSMLGPVVIQKTLYFSGSTVYHIEVSSMDDGYDATVGNHTTDSRFRAASQGAAATGTITRSLPFGEPQTDGAALVQYRPVGTGGTLALTWDGKVLSPSQTRSFVNAEGHPVTEALFRKNGAIPATTHLRLNANVNPGGEIFLYSWGMMSL